MSFQVPSPSIGITTFFEGMCLLSSMNKFMYFQVASLLKMFTTFLAGMWLLFPLDKFMSFQAAGLSIGFTNNFYMHIVSIFYG